MFMALVLPKAFQELLQVLPTDFPFFLRKFQHLVARILDGPRLMDAHMAGFCRHHPFIRLEQSVDHHQVGLGAPYKEKNLGLWAATGLPDFLLSL